MKLERDLILSCGALRHISKWHVKGWVTRNVKGQRGPVELCRTPIPTSQWKLLVHYFDAVVGLEKLGHLVN